jgi:putative ABC transport system permease protein
MSALLKKSWKDLSRRKARTIFTIITVALGVMGIGLFAITPLADRAVQAELRAEKMHNVGVRVTAVPLTAEQLAALKSLDNVGQLSPQAELLVTIAIGGRRERALLVGVPDYADQAVDVVRVTSGEVPRGMQVLTDQGNAANAVISLSAGDDITVQDPTGTTNRLSVTGVGKNFLHSGATRGGVAVFYTSLDAIEQISGRTGFTNLNFTLQDTAPGAMAKTVEVVRDYLVANTSVVAFDALADVREDRNETIVSTFLTVSFVVVLIVLIGLMSTLVMNILDRTTEIGMLRCIGAQSKDVRRLFSTEGLFLAFPGVDRGPSAGLRRVPGLRRRVRHRDEAHDAQQVRLDLRRLVARLRNGRHADRDLLPSPARHQHEAR